MRGRIHQRKRDDRPQILDHLLRDTHVVERRAGAVGYVHDAREHATLVIVEV
jgi:hypothetical protein